MGRADVTVVWFKRDLRVDDHRPLAAAAERGGAVLPLYVVEPDYWAQPDQHPRQYAFVRTGLVELRERLGELGAPLVVRTGDVVEVLERLRVEHGVSGVVAHEETGTGWTYARDKRVIAWARANRVGLEEWPTNAVTRGPYDRDDWTSIWNRRMAEPITPAPDRLDPVPDIDPGPVPTVADLGLDPLGGLPAPAAGVLDVQPGGIAEAQRVLDSFLSERYPGYEAKLSSPVTAWDACSRLSPFLTWGHLSLRQVVQPVHRLSGALPKRDPRRRSLSAFIERLHWRCHFVQKLEDEPEIEFRSFVREFDAIRQRSDPAKLEAWATGHTGYPMVDASMRALVQTGWINFRMRAMLVSFAAYDLWLPWRDIGVHLARCFTDYEPGIHWSQVQMQAGTTGINALRIYDPTKQAIDHDPDGVFIRRWIPELSDTATAVVHQPGLYAAAGAVAYPPPIVDHAAAARRAGSEIDRIRRQVRRDGRAADVVERHGSRRPPPSRRGPTDRRRTRSR